MAFCTGCVIVRNSKYFFNHYKGQLFNGIFKKLSIIPWTCRIYLTPQKELNKKQKTSSPPSWWSVLLPSSSFREKKVCLFSVPQAQACVIYALSIAFTNIPVLWELTGHALCTGGFQEWPLCGPRHCSNLPVLKGFAFSR